MPTPEVQPEAKAGLAALMLREVRLRRGLTQLQLAQHAGFSERLIRKAEAGGPVRMHTLEVLAEALSTPEHPVTPADLRGDALAVVQTYYRLRREHSYGFARHIRHLLGNDYSVTVHADPATVPYAGTYHGVEGLEEMYTRVGRYFRPLGESVRFFSAPGRVMGMREGRVQPVADADGRPLEPLPSPRKTWILQEWTVCEGKITRDELYVDSQLFHLPEGASEDVDPAEPSERP